MYKLAHRVHYIIPHEQERFVDIKKPDPKIQI